MLLYATIQTAYWQRILQFFAVFLFTFWPWKIYSLIYVKNNATDCCKLRTDMPLKPFY